MWCHAGDLRLPVDIFATMYRYIDDLAILSNKCVPWILENSIKASFNVNMIIEKLMLASEKLYLGYRVVRFHYVC